MADVDDEPPVPRPRPAAPLPVRSATAPIDHGAAGVWAFIVVVLMVALVTVVVGISHWHRGQARRELVELIRRGEAADNPRPLVDALDDYLRTHPESDLSLVARERLEQARAELEQHDFARADALDHPAQSDLDAAEAAYRDYLAAHPDGPNRPRAEARLRALADERDDRTYDECVRLARATPNDLTAQQKAWETYLEAYPKGRHVAAARAQLAQLPEKEARLRLERDTARIQKLIDARQFVEALDQLEDITAATRDEARRRALGDLARQAEASLQEADAEFCLGEFEEGGDERDRRIAACRLFLLCYPDGPRRDAVARRLAALTAGRPAAPSANKPRTNEELLDEFAGRLLANIEQAVRRVVPDTFDYRLLGSTVATVPITWTFDRATHRERLLSKDAQPFHGKVLVELKGTVKRDPSGSVRENLKTDIDDELRSLSARLLVTAEFEIQARPETVSGVGVELEDGREGVVVRRVIDGTQAAKFGVEPGDRVVRVDGEPVPPDARRPAVEAMIANGKPAGVEITFLRSARRFRVVLPASTRSVPRYKMRTKIEIAPARPFGEPPPQSDWIDIDPPS